MAVRIERAAAKKVEGGGFVQDPRHAEVIAEPVRFGTEARRHGADVVVVVDPGSMLVRMKGTHLGSGNGIEVARYLDGKVYRVPERLGMVFVKAGQAVEATAADLDALVAELDATGSAESAPSELA